MLITIYCVDVQDNQLACLFLKATDGRSSLNLKRITWSLFESLSLLTAKSNADLPWSHRPYQITPGI